MATGGAQDEAQLDALGYQQSFKREMSLWANFAVGFTYLSPVVGVYTLFAFGLATAGPPMIWTYLIVGAGQFLVALVFGEIVSQYPLAGGVYPWARRLWGRRWAWMTGWIYVIALQVGVASVAYGAGPFVAGLLGLQPTQWTFIVSGIGIVMLVTLLNVGGTKVLSWAAILGFSAEIIGAIVVGTYLLVTQRVNSPAVIFDSMGAGAGNYVTAFLAATLTGIFMFLGFEACGSTAEEVRDASLRVPRSMRLSIYVGGAAAVFVCLSLLLSVPDIPAVISGEEADPVGAILGAAFGETGVKFVLAILVLSFVSCAVSLQAATSRVLFSFGRDRMLPGSEMLARMSRRHQAPYAAILLASIVPMVVIIGSRLSESALTRIVSFTVLGFYLAFQMVVLAALRARLHGWVPSGKFSLGKTLGLGVNVGALTYGVAAIVNLAWPRTPEVPWYDNYIVLLSGVVVIAAGIAYLFLKRPHLNSDAQHADAIGHSIIDTSRAHMFEQIVDGD